MADTFRPYRLSLLIILSTLLLQGCGITPGQRGATTGAAVGGGIALLAGASPWGVLGGSLLGGGVGYVAGHNTNLFK